MMKNNMKAVIENISQETFFKKLKFVESIIEKSGAVCVGKTEEKVSEISGNHVIDSRDMIKKVWKFRNRLVRIDYLCFSQKPSIVLEFSDRIEGPYEDADPFPYDLPEDEMELEVKYALGILPYPEWNERFRANGLMSQYACLLTRSRNYIIYKEYEDAYLKNVNTGEIIGLGDYYGDPEIAFIDSEEKFCMTAGYDKICIYFFKEKQYKTAEFKREWIASVNQEDSMLTIIYEDGTRSTFDVYE